MARIGIALFLILALLLLSFGCAGVKEGGTEAVEKEAGTAVTEKEAESPGAEEGEVESEVAGKEAGTAVTEKETESEAVEETPAGAVFEAGSPVSSFSEEDIAYLGIACSGTDEEIAGCIRKWQENNMIYASPDKGYHDAGDAIHWNYFLPGIFPSKEIIYEHTDNGKIYGICFDFAVIYCSIAEYYGLECRVMNTKTKPSEGKDSSEPTTGMRREEYDRLKLKLEKNGLDYSYGAVNSVAEETPTHYWAEVYLNGEWVITDSTQKTTGGNTSNEFIATNDFEVTDWLSRDKTELLANYSYEGITDDLGQSGRAANIYDLMQGLAFAPYFDDVEAACDFVGAGDNLTKTDLSEAMEDKEAYESCSGKKLYLVCYFICDGDDLEGTAWVERYELYSGEKLDMECARDIIEGF